jgi:Uma2 family endonuclease
MAEPQLRRMTPEEFLAWQQLQDALHELVDGAPDLPPKMLTGTSQAHDRLVVNLIAALHAQLRGGPYRPATGSLAINIPGGNVRRPDVAIDGGSPDLRALSATEPRIIIEVISPETVDFARVRKIAEYQAIPTVSHILLVDTQAPRVDVWSRDGSVSWTQGKVDGMEGVIELPAVKASLRLADVFEGLHFGGSAGNQRESR